MSLNKFASITLSLIEFSLPWDIKNLNFMKSWDQVKMLVIHLCPTLCNPMDWSPPGSSVHGILQAGILEWVAMPSSRGSFGPRDWTQVSCIAGRFFTTQPPEKMRRGVQSQLKDSGFKSQCELHSFIKWPMGFPSQLWCLILLFSSDETTLTSSCGVLPESSIH